MRIFDKTGTVRLQENGNDVRPEIDRGALRGILLNSLPPGVIHWGSKVTSVINGENGRHKVMLENGETFTTSLLVGADGAWSKVRPLVSSAQPIYLGISFAETRFLNVDEDHPGIAAVVGSGSMFALSDEKGLLAHRDGERRINVYAAVKAAEPWAVPGAVDFGDRGLVRARLMEYFSGWDEKLLALITDGDIDFVPRSIYTLPIGHSWERVPGVTLIGDAAHLMSPFAGEGANLAMLDGADLAETILAYPGDAERALAEYEAKTFPRSKEAAAESASNLAISFRSDAPKGLLDLFAQFDLQRTSAG